MEERDKREEMLGCFVFLSRGIAVMIAGGGLIEGLMAGNPKIMMGAVVGAGLYYLSVWLGAKLIIKGLKKTKDQ